MTEEGSLQPDSSEKQTPKLKPPIRGPDWFDRLFALIQQRRIDRIDAKFVKANITPDPSGASKFLAGLRFLDLIDDQGAVTLKLESLQLTGDKFRTNLEKIVRDAYKDVFEEIRVEDFDSTEDLRNFFIKQYGMSGGFARRAVWVFQYLSGKAGILLPDNEESPSEQEPESTGSKILSRKRRVSKAKPTGPKNTVPEGIELLQLGDVRVWLPKGDRKAANTAKTLIDLYMQNLQEGK
jgi:Family of unknown function (DUF5343)